MALGARRAVSMVVRKVVVTGDVRSLRCNRSVGVCLSAGGSNGVGRCRVLSSVGGVIGAILKVHSQVWLQCRVADDSTECGYADKSGSKRCCGCDVGSRIMIRVVDMIKRAAARFMTAVRSA